MRTQRENRTNYRRFASVAILAGGFAMFAFQSRAEAQSTRRSRRTHVWSGAAFQPRLLSTSAAKNRARFQYLGKLSSNRYDSDSINNPYGRFGSPYSSVSVRNRFGRFGSPYSSVSATNPYATRAPRIVWP